MVRESNNSEDKKSKSYSERLSNSAPNFKSITKEIIEPPQFNEFNEDNNLSPLKIIYYLQIIKIHIPLDKKLK